MKHIKFLFIIFIMIIVIVLAIQNHEAFSTKVIFKVDLKIFYYETPELSIYLISLIAFILGVLVTWVYFILERFQYKRQINSLRNESKQKDKELNSLRNLPITTENVTPAVLENDIELT